MWKTGEIRSNLGCMSSGWDGFEFFLIILVGSRVIVGLDKGLLV